MKLIIAPDSFKGTLTATQVCNIIAQAFVAVFPGVEILCIPMADGGEGMVQTWRAACGGVVHTAAVSGPHHEAVKADYLLLPDGCAVLETASCAGLELARPLGLNPGITSTRGLGLLLRAAEQQGAARIVLGLGGSATNDAGCGMAHALGWQFLDSNGNNFCPAGSTLCDIMQILPPEQPFPLPVTAACDVQAPLHGPQGAAHIYAKQKGADDSMIYHLDKGLQHIAALMSGYEAIPGAGAAGGLGFGVLAFLGGELHPGANMLLDCAGFGNMLENADLVITGEGRMDVQTLQGKAPFAVLQRAKETHIPVLGICGSLGPGSSQLLDAGFLALYPSAGPAQPLEALRYSCRDDLYAAAIRAAKRWESGGFA